VKRVRSDGHQSISACNKNIFFTGEKSNDKKDYQKILHGTQKYTILAYATEIPYGNDRFG
jgi:hypothetical protein